MRKFLIIAGCLVAFVVLAFRFLMSESGGAREEREWFAARLQYEFSAIVDSAACMRGSTGPGRMWCRLVSGNIKPEREDSLSQHLEKYNFLDFITHRSGDSLMFAVLGAERFLPGDSLCVSSQRNEIHYFRKGVHIITEPLSVTLEGRGTKLMY